MDRSWIVDRPVSRCPLTRSHVEHRQSPSSVRSIVRAIDSIYPSLLIRVYTSSNSCSSRGEAKNSFEWQNEAKLDAGFANEGEREETRLKVRPRDYARSRGRNGKEIFQRSGLK